MKRFLVFATCFSVFGNLFKSCSKYVPGPDPRDYIREDYYFKFDYYVLQFDFSFDQMCYIYKINGKKSYVSYTYYYYRYVSNEYANYRLDYSNAYPGYDAFMLYDIEYGKDGFDEASSAIVVWAKKYNGSYTLILDSTSTISEKEVPSSSSITGLDNLVRGNKYIYNDTNYFNFREKDIVYWCYNGEYLLYDYLCVSYGRANYYYKDVSSEYSKYVLVYNGSVSYLLGISDNSISLGSYVYRLI